MSDSRNRLRKNIVGVAYSAAMSMALGSAAAGDDRLLVGTLEQQVEIYDVAGGSSMPRPAVALPDGITAMERSRGGAWLYVATYFGDLLMVDTRVSTFFATPDSVGAGVSALAVSPNRSEVYLNSGGPSVAVQDGAGAGRVATVMLADTTTGSIDRLAVTNAGDRVYAWDQNTGELREWNLASGAVSTVAMFRYDIWEMGVSADDGFVVMAGPDTWHAAPLGDPSNPAHILIYNLANGLEYHAAIPGGDIPVGIAFDRNNLSKFWVGTVNFVQPVVFTHTLNLPSITLSPSPLGQAYVRDIDANEGGDLYVLFDDRIDLYPPAGAARTVATFNDDQIRLHLEVVPALGPPPDRPTARMRSRWNGLIVAALERRWRLPWKLRPEWVKCPDCDEKQLKQDREEAAAYLGKLKRDMFLDVAEAGAFLAGGGKAEAAGVPAFLDDLFVVPGKRTRL